MSDNIAPRAWTWPLGFRATEIRAHGIVVGPAVRPEQSNYGVVGGLPSGVFRLEGDNPYVVHPQTPLRNPPLDQPRSPIDSNTQPSPISGASPDLEPQDVSLDDRMEDLFAGDRSNEATVGDSSDVARDPVFSSTWPGFDDQSSAMEGGRRSEV